MKPKYYPLLILVPALLLFCGWVTGIHWYTDEPVTTTLADTDAFSYQKVGPNAYRYITVGNMKSVFQGLPGAPAVNVYITTNYTTNAFITFLNVTTNYTTNAFITFLTVNTNYTTNAYITVLTVNTNYTTNAFITYLTSTTNFFDYSTTTNAFITYLTVNTNYTTNAFLYYLTVYSNAYFFETNFVNWDITTNLTVISNATVRGNLTINNIRITNGFHRALTTWVGPTNSLDVGTNFWIYTAPSDCAITNFTGGIAGFASDTALVVTNAATSNITFRITASGNFLDYVKSYTVTNGDVLHLAIERQGTAGADVVGRTGHPL